MELWPHPDRLATVTATSKSILVQIPRQAILKVAATFQVDELLPGHGERILTASSQKSHSRLSPRGQHSPRRSPPPGTSGGKGGGGGKEELGGGGGGEGGDVERGTEQSQSSQTEPVQATTREQKKLVRAIARRAAGHFALAIPRISQLLAQLTAPTRKGVERPGFPETLDLLLNAIRFGMQAFDIGAMYESGFFKSLLLCITRDDANVVKCAWDILGSLCVHKPLHTELVTSPRREAFLINALSLIRPEAELAIAASSNHQQPTDMGSDDNCSLTRVSSLPHSLQLAATLPGLLDTCDRITPSMQLLLSLASESDLLEALLRLGLVRRVTGTLIRDIINSVQHPLLHTPQQLPHQQVDQIAKLNQKLRVLLNVALGLLERCASSASGRMLLVEEHVFTAIAPQLAQSRSMPEHMIADLNSFCCRLLKFLEEADTLATSNVTPTLRASPFQAPAATQAYNRDGQQSARQELLAGAEDTEAVNAGAAGAWVGQCNATSIADDASDPVFQEKERIVEEKGSGVGDGPLEEEVEGRGREGDSGGAKGGVVREGNGAGGGGGGDDVESVAPNVWQLHRNRNPGLDAEPLQQQHHLLVTLFGPRAAGRVFRDFPASCRPLPREPGTHAHALTLRFMGREPLP